jgi:hypothetical protein
MNFDGDEDFAGLLVVGWDKIENVPIAAATVEPWFDLTIAQERAVWQLIAALALENCAEFAVPDTVDDMFPE